MLERMNVLKENEHMQTYHINQGKYISPST